MGQRKERAPPSFRWGMSRDLSSRTSGGRGQPSLPQPCPAQQEALPPLQWNQGPRDRLTCRWDPSEPRCPQPGISPASMSPQLQPAPSMQLAPSPGGWGVPPLPVDTPPHCLHVGATQLSGDLCQPHPSTRPPELIPVPRGDSDGGAGSRSPESHPRAEGGGRQSSEPGAPRSLRVPCVLICSPGQPLRCPRVGGPDTRDAIAFQSTLAGVGAPSPDTPFCLLSLLPKAEWQGMGRASQQDGEHH